LYGRDPHVHIPEQKSPLILRDGQTLFTYLFKIIDKFPSCYTLNYFLQLQTIAYTFTHRQCAVENIVFIGVTGLCNDMSHLHILFCDFIPNSHLF
jgi:hypothetical protein